MPNQTSIERAPKATPSGGSKRIQTVSHTLEEHLADRLRNIAFRERVSESSIIEYALRGLLTRADDEKLGQLMRDAGAALRRKSPV